MNVRFKIIVVIASLFMMAAQGVWAQSGAVDRLKSLGRMGGGGGDSLMHRTGLEDSITISFRYLDSSRYRKADSSLNDFNKKLPVPADYVFLGNNGSPARPMVFTPNMKAGWDPGFHAYDIYHLNIEDTRFYTTTRPYSEIGYVLGSKVEQMIKLLHTQNITPDWNAAFQYNLVNAPGFFKNQTSNHNNLRFNSSYQSKNRRYHAFLIAISNKIQSGENGGIRDTADMNNLLTYSDRALVPVQLGNSSSTFRNVFNTTLNTGNLYKNTQLMFRHQYDFGIKDSLVMDSSIVRLFYPKFRLEHTIRSGSYNYNFIDRTAASEQDTFYRQHYGFIVNPDTVSITDKWKELVNDFSIYQFPDSKNAQQFIRVGATIQSLKGNFSNDSRGLHNVFLHGEYRNKTRNRKWDIEANGQLYVNGFNSGDYNAYISLQRYISKQLGYLQAGFQNVNRTPSFIFDNSSSFNRFTDSLFPSFNKENITNIFASIDQPVRGLRLTGNYYLISNYTYFKDYYRADQAATLFNLLQITASKHFRVGKRWNWDVDVTLQQTTGPAPINVPLIYTRNRFYFQGNLGFKNLMLLFGTEVKYHTDYKADGYSPVKGQFFIQKEETISLKAPDIAAFLHFRIKTFTAYLRAQNLNAVSFQDGFGFSNNNYAAPDYPYPGLLIRFGIFWGFVN